MNAVLSVSQIQYIPLNKLKRSDENVRKVPHTRAQIEALANSIQVHGQIQNLIVKTECAENGEPTGHYLVSAGEGRRQAQLCRVKRKQIKADEPIACIVDDARNAVAVSLAENELRSGMSALEQFLAFKALSDAGQSIEDIAAQFSVTPLIVHRRLKLANLAPEFIELHRKGSVGLDVLMALALVDDHAKQRSVWKGLRKDERRADIIRERLTESEMATDEPLAVFVGLPAYEKAGGPVRRDLFSEDGADGYIMDVELLRRLAQERLEAECAKLRGEGWSWTEYVTYLDYSAFATYGRVHTTHREATAEETAAITQLKDEQAQLEETFDQGGEEGEDAEAIQERLDAIEQQLSALYETLEVPDSAQQALAGALVSIGRDGQLRVERGLLRPEDKMRFARVAKKPGTGPKEQVAPKVHSAALTQRLTAHLTLGVQAELCGQPRVAVVALTHRLALRTFYPHGSSSAVQIEADNVDFSHHGEDVAKSEAGMIIAEQREALRSLLPPEPSELLAFLLEMPWDSLLGVLAFCIAISVDGVHGDERSHPIFELASALKVDMRNYWTADAKTYLASVPKARVLEVIREVASPEVADALSHLKKADLVKSAEGRLVGKGWLPGILRLGGK